ncbi:efflux RND transporter periplasmic adaptor subunit [Aquimarina sp. M1]
MRILYLILFFSVIVSCKNEVDFSSQKDSFQNNQIHIDSVLVKTTYPTKGMFTKEIITTGKLQAQKKVNLVFKFNSVVNKINVSNGDKVLNGNIIASQKNNANHNTIQRNREALSRSLIDTEDILLGFGYSLDNESKIPKDILKMAKDRSGYFTATANLKDAKMNLDETILKSPIKGVVVNLDHKVMNVSDNTKVFCTIIDDSMMEIQFSVLEEQYSFIEKNQLIAISIGGTFNKIFDGKIVEINAQINKDGFIKVKGIVENPSSTLLDGMNVQVVIKKPLTNKISIPKSALVYRDGKKVVFTYENGSAVWNDVIVGEENRNEIIINQGLTIDQRIIYMGNHNLAHHSKVYLSEND